MRKACEIAPDPLIGRVRPKKTYRNERERDLAPTVVALSQHSFLIRVVVRPKPTQPLFFRVWSRPD
jgi:hypothetical protein